MKVNDKTQEQLIEELEGMKQRVSELHVIEKNKRQVDEELWRSENELSIMNRIAEIFVSVSDDEMYGDVLQVVLEAMESPYGTFAYINEHGERVVPSMTRDIWDKCKIPDKDIVFPRERWSGVWGRCLIARESLFSNGPFKVPEGHIPIRRALAVPIIHKGEVIGNFMVGNKKTEYGKRDVELLENIAHRVAPILKAKLNRDREEKERKCTEEKLQASYRFLEIANKYTEMTPLLKEFVAALKELTNCKAVGIRVLDRDGNIPYQAFDGFSEAFYRSESPLSIKADRCMCISVIKGTSDPKFTFFTEGGSFFMNGTTRFLATVPEREKGQTRNVCNQFGYESVALVPIRSGDHILGLIHVADPRENAVPIDLVEAIEWTAMELGTAIRRVQGREALRRAYDELEYRVEERTAEVTAANELLKQEIEERKKAEERLAERIRLEGLRAEVGVALAKGDTLRTLLQPCTEALLEHLDAAFARIWTYNESEGMLELQASAGLYTRIDGSRSRVAMGESKIGIVAQERRPYITNTIIGDPDIIDQEWAKREGMEAFAGYPLVFSDVLVGVMAMFAKESLSEFTLNALASVADQIALGIQRQRAEEAFRKSGEELRLLSSQLLTAQEEERGRIARELHDGIGQSLSAIKFKLEHTLSHMEEKPGGSTLNTLEAIVTLTQDAVEEVRKITMDLRPSTLDDLGILATVNWFSREFQKIYSSIRVKTDINLEEKDVPESLKIVIYRVLQEALNNVAKHSKANTVSVKLSMTDGCIELIVEDYGKGFELDEALSADASERGFGLGIMRERTEFSDGTFAIDSAKGRGTIVRASWPTERSQNGRQE